MKKSYSNKVAQRLEENKINLSILFEEDDKDEKKDDDIGDLFSDDSFKDDENKEDSSDDAKDDVDVKDDVDSKEKPEDDEKGPEQDTTELDEENLNNLSDQVSYMKNFFEKIKKDDGTSSVENYISSAVASNINAASLAKLTASFLRKGKSISSFLMFEEKADKELEKVEAELDDIERVLTKGSEIVNKFKKGKDIDIQSYVDAAVNAYKNFDSLFAKELIVKQATINVLILNSGAKAEMNIREFEELFHEELHKQFNIEYEEHALITKKSNTAAGAKSQS